MTNLKTTRGALLASIASLVICFSMLLGTTFAWFTDSVSSSGNIIQTGTLDISLEHSDAILGANDEGWVDAAAGAIFNYDKWEPGYTAVKYVKIENEGSLDLKFTLNIVPNAAAEEVNLADVIEVYMINEATPVDRAALATDSAAYVGTLSELMAENDGAAHGVLYADDADKAGNVYEIYTIALKMSTSAGNDFMGKSVGGGFSVNLLAGQLASEFDSIGNQYDIDANYVTPVATLDAFFTALEEGNDILLEDPIAVNESFINYMNERYSASTFALGDETVTIDKDAVIDAGGITVYRTEKTANVPLINVAEGYSLTLSNIILDGGAVWTGEVDATLGRPIANSGMTTTGTLITLANNAHLVLNEGTVLQNNDGGAALYPSFKSDATVTLNGAWIVNNNTNGGTGAIWGGANITVNEGSKINSNYSSSNGGVIRMVSQHSLTVNGGEINNNKALGTGGVIYDFNYGRYYFRGGEMANNEAGTGGAMYIAERSIIEISGDFKLINNIANDAGAIRMSDYTQFIMTGGTISGNVSRNSDEWDGFYGYNAIVNISGGVLLDNVTIQGGHKPVLGGDGIDGTVYLSTAWAHLAENYDTISFEISDSYINSFCFYPATGYTYTEGDEAKLICLNEGYETYWNAEKDAFYIREIAAE